MAVFAGIVNGAGCFTRFSANIGEKVITAAGGKVVNVSVDHERCRVINKTVQRSIAASNHNTFFIGKRTEKRCSY